MQNLNFHCVDHKAMNTITQNNCWHNLFWKQAMEIRWQYKTYEKRLPLNWNSLWEKVLSQISKTSDLKLFLRHLKAHTIWETKVVFLSLFSCNFDDQWVRIYENKLQNTYPPPTCINKMLGVKHNFNLIGYFVKTSLVILYDSQGKTSFSRHSQVTYVLE